MIGLVGVLEAAVVLSAVAAVNVLLQDQLQLFQTLKDLETATSTKPGRFDHPEALTCIKAVWNNDVCRLYVLELWLVGRQDASIVKPEFEVKVYLVLDSVSVRVYFDRLHALDAASSLRGDEQAGKLLELVEEDTFFLSEAEGDWRVLEDRLLSPAAVEPHVSEDVVFLVHFVLLLEPVDQASLARLAVEQVEADVESISPVEVTVL